MIGTEKLNGEYCGSNWSSIDCCPLVIGSKIGSRSFMLTSVVGVGTLIGCMEVCWVSSSVLFSNLYPFVAVLLGVAVVVRLLVETALKSFVAAIVVLLLSVGALVTVAKVDFVLVVVAVEFLICPVYLIGMGVVFDDFGDGGALVSV